MKAQTLEALKLEAIRQYDLVKERKRQRYHLARKLGFSAPEAKVLSGRSIEYIWDLAGQQKAG